MYLISEEMVQTKSKMILLLFLLINGSNGESTIKNDAVLTSVGETRVRSSVTNAQQRFLTVHDVSAGSNINTYIWPKELCQVVVFCDYTAAAENDVQGTNTETKLNVAKLCTEEKLVYFAYESAIQKIGEDGKIEKKIYLQSPALRFENGGEKKIKIVGFSDFDNVEKTPGKSEELVMKLEGKLATLTSSPYCQIRLDYDGNMNVASFKTLLVNNATNPLTIPEEDLQEYSYFTKADHSKTESILLDDVTSVKNPQNETARAECNDFWDLPQYARKSGTNEDMLMQEYTFKYDTSTTTSLASFVLDTQDHAEKTGSCDWIKLCLGNHKNCTVPSHSVELLFQYGMFVPTDSDSGHAFGAPRKHLRRIQFEIRKNKNDKYIMLMNYALAGQKQEALLSHVMRLKDTFKPDNGEEGTLTLIQGPKCNARLLNDWGSLQSTGHNSMKKKEQKITIRKCSVIEEPKI